MIKNTTSIINLKNVDYTKTPVFFGESLGLQRYDKFKHEKIFNLFKQQLGFYWRPEEINISKDRADYASLSDHEKFIFTKNLGYQILLDSVQSRGISSLLENCSNPEIEAFAKTWEFFETLHSYSYTYIIKNVYNNPSDLFDTILTDPEIIKRTESVTKYYDSLINGIPDDSLYNKKKKLYLTLMSINILEGIRFYVSFACSYCFAQNKKMIGNSLIIELINRDENLHMGFTSFLLKILADESNEGFTEVAADCRELVIQMFRDAAQEEIEWANYLFKDGSMLGLNAEILQQYMKWLTNNRMKMVKLPPIFDKVSNPISWIGKYTESKSVQTAAQEAELTNYVTGSVKQDADDANYEEFDI